MEVRDPAALSQFTVQDMECAGCVAKVERAIHNLDGVAHISTSLMAQKVKVHYHPALVDEAQIAAAIRGAGYAVERETEEETPFWKNREKLLTALSGLFLFIGLVVQLSWPEPVHTTLWQGHLGPPDLLLLVAALLGGFNFFPQGLRAL